MCSFCTLCCELSALAFLYCKSDKQKLLIQQSYPREWFAEAPLYIVVCADSSVAWVRKTDNKNHSDIDAAITTEHICLAATEQGLGSCWVCNFDSDTLKENLHLSPNEYPVAIISLGYVKKCLKNYLKEKILPK